MITLCTRSVGYIWRLWTIFSIAFLILLSIQFQRKFSSSVVTDIKLLWAKCTKQDDFLPGWNNKMMMMMMKGNHQFRVKLCLEKSIAFLGRFKALYSIFVKSRIPQIFRTFTTDARSNPFYLDNSSDLRTKSLDNYWLKYWQAQDSNPRPGTEFYLRFYWKLNLTVNFLQITKSNFVLYSFSKNWIKLTNLII